MVSISVRSTKFAKDRNSHPSPNVIVSLIDCDKNNRTRARSVRSCTLNFFPNGRRHGVDRMINTDLYHGVFLAFRVNINNFESS